ncbi:MAG TPA: LUD domain-containing protein [Terriglobales bacterium]|nr:LUD domain-containing protein [Terriglobales bacterium]HET7872665.1 LUD domain-containing protein [Terriglobales bacterium]
MSSVTQSATMSLVDAFERAATATAATVERVARTSDQIAAAVARVAPAGPLAVAVPLDLPADLFDACRRLPGAFDARSRKAMDDCVVGITDAFAGVAHSGSICVCIDHDHAGFVSLLSRFHIAVLPAENIVQRPGDLFRLDRLNGDGLRRNFVFITGPSATADMGPLVRGVHGPHRLHIIVV